MTDAKIADVLPLRPADEGDADPLTRPEGGPASPKADHARTRTREGKGRAWMPWTLRISAIFAGASVVASPAPSLEVIWARHCQSARFYKHWWAKVPAWLYGVLHTWVLAAPAYFLVWATDSRPKLVATALVIITSLWLLHII